METTNTAVLESKENTLVIPTDLAAHLKKNASLIITEARKYGAISTREITAILQPTSVSDRYRLKDTIGLLDSFLTGIGISLARGKVDLEKRVLPLPRLVTGPSLNLRFRPIKDSDLQLLASLNGEQSEFDDSEVALYRDVMRRFPLLTYDQSVELFKRRATGDLEAQYLLILHNLKLVFHWAYKYQNRGLDLADLVQEGVMGLMKAIEKYEWQRGLHVSTYASQWIRSVIARAVMDMGRTVRLPVHFAEKYQTVLRMAKALQGELGREATHEEIGQRMSLPARFISRVFKIVADSETGSLDDSLTENEDSGDIYKVTADTMVVSPSDILEAKEKLEEVAAEVRAFLIKLATLTTFDDRWRQMFRMRYGLSGTFFARPTLETVGEKFGVTRERIRQIIEACWVRLNADGSKFDEEWLLAKMNQIEELESVTGMFTKI
jgi:RNA polymerase sigma factor (sigma-70 family)